MVAGQGRQFQAFARAQPADLGDLGLRDNLRVQIQPEDLGADRKPGLMCGRGGEAAKMGGQGFWGIQSDFLGQLAVQGGAWAFDRIANIAGELEACRISTRVMTRGLAERGWQTY